MKKLTKLLALVLAVVMLLPATALAADNSANDGPKLMMNWLDWDENGLCYVRDECLSGEDRGTDVLGTAPGDEPCVIFFTVGADGKRTPVIPKAGKGVTIETVEKESIAPNAKQSKYYVRVRLDDWGESEVTSGKATMKVVAELPQVGLYTTPEATKESYLRNDQQPYDPSKLTDKTVYFITIATDEDHGRHVTDVKKNSNGNSNMYDLEKVSDSVWKITLKLGDEGGMGVNLDFTWLDTDGNTYDEHPGWGFEYPHGPELWSHYLEWNEEKGIYLPEGNDNGYGFNICPGNEFIQIFYKCDYDDKGNQTFTPVPVSELKGSAGLTITPLEEGESKDKLADYFVRLTVADWNKEYTISAGEYTAKLTSNLPDFGIYSKPELTTDSYLRDWRFSVTDPNETVYVGSYIPEGDDRFLADLKLAKFENSDQFTLEKYNDDFYKLTRKSINIDGMNIEFEGAWGWPDGNTEPMQAGIWTEPYTSGLVSSEQVLVINNSYDYPSYESLKSKVSNQLTLKAGEAQTVYLSRTYLIDGSWTILPVAPQMWAPSSDALKLTVEDGETCKYSISCDTPGTYMLSMQGYWAEKFINEKGEDVTDYVNSSDEMFYWDFDWRTGKTIVGQGVDEEAGKVTDLLEGWSVELQYEPLEWFPITVTVTGEAAKPAFTDVTANAWYAPAVSYANSKGYMKGNSDTTFNPTGKIKGSEFAQILYNKEGKPAAAEGAAFQGVTDQWYAPAVLWAAGKGIVTDTGDAAVVPTADLTREQIALMLYNYMGKPEAKGELTAFTDAAKVSAWAKDAMAWAVGEGVLKGSDNALNPTGTATRAETAQILMNFFK